MVSENISALWIYISVSILGAIIAMLIRILFRDTE
ncbi:hypothetical protein [Pedobacter sp.]